MNQQHSMIIEMLTRIEKKINALSRNSKTLHSTWVKASVIQELTGWGGRSGIMQWARDNGLVVFRKNKNGTVEYLLQSINPMFLKKTLQLRFNPFF